VAVVSVMTIAFFSLFCYRGDYAMSKGDGKRSFGALAVFLSVGLDYRDGEVVAEVTNRLTVFPGEVSVTVRLYRSDENPITSDVRMEAVAEVFVEDLDFTERVGASYPTEGKSSFWMAEVVYSVDGGAEQAMDTDVILFDGNGNVLDLGKESK